MSRTLAQEYIVVVGPRGTGKSRVVDAVVADTPGVLRLSTWASPNRLSTRFSAALGENLVREFPERTANVILKRSVSACGVCVIATHASSGRPTGCRRSLPKCTAARRDRRWCTASRRWHQGASTPTSKLVPRHSRAERCRRRVRLCRSDGCATARSCGSTISRPTKPISLFSTTSVASRFDSASTPTTPISTSACVAAWFEFDRHATRRARASRQSARSCAGLRSLDERVDALISEQLDASNTKCSASLFEQEVRRRAVPIFSGWWRRSCRTPERAVSAETLDGDLKIHGAWPRRVLKEVSTR
jgi:hypothetical protein